MVTLPWTWLATAGAALLVVLGEWLHGRRTRRLARLAFGPTGLPAPWVRAVPALRAVAAGLLAWGLCTLLQLPPKVHESDQLSDEDYRHLVLLMDVSPSMMLRDSGPNGTQSRRERTRELIESLFERVAIGKYKISVIAFFNGAIPVVLDTRDIEVVRHILGELEMRYAFKRGKTQLMDGIEEAVRIARAWPKDSALLVLVSDGDTVPPTGMPELPVAYSGAIVIGVGDPVTGRFLDGHQSRQDISSLRQVATRLGGEFHDGNRRHIPSDVISAATEDSRKPLVERLTLREYALLAIAAGAAVLATLPVLLHFLGTGWRPGHVPAATRAAGREAIAG
ncbi:MAG: VWA domain-containing protein [Planctomycetota bacterium]